MADKYYIKKKSNETDPDTLDPSKVSVMSDEEEAEEFGGISEGQAKLLRSSLKAASDGISKGISMDFASQRKAESYIGSAVDAILAPLVLSMPSARELERTVRPSSNFLESNADINSEAIARLEKGVLSPSVSLYQSNFKAFISVMNKISDSIPEVKKGLGAPNDISNIEALAIEFKGTDRSVTNFSQKSPYKIIIKQIIPILREKFDAVASFDASLGTGSKIDYQGISQDFYEGMDDEADAEDLVRFYKAITEWHSVINAFSSGETSLSGARAESKEKGGKEQGDEEEGSDVNEESSEESDAVAGNILIYSIRPGQHTHVDPTGSGSIYISHEAIYGEEIPVVKLYVKGGSADQVNSSGSGESYLKYFIDNRTIVFSEDADYRSVISEVTRESVSGGAEITLYFNPKALRRMISAPDPGRVPVMSARTNRGSASVFVDSVAQIRELRRVASDQTTSYYQAKSPYSGEMVYFTPTDLVVSGGKIKDSKGKSFKPKNIKGKSLASRVNSKGFGKVKKK